MRLRQRPGLVSILRTAATLHWISVLSQGELLHGRDDSGLADADRRGRDPDSAVVSVSRNDPPRVRLLPRENAFP
jgi:hypothetical protein